MFGQNRNLGPYQNTSGPTPEVLLKEKDEALAKAAKQHTDLMYANTQLLKSVKYASGAFVVGAIIIGVMWYWNRPKAAAPSAISAPAAAPAPAPVVVPPAPLMV